MVKIILKILRDNIGESEFVKVTPIQRVRISVEEKALLSTNVDGDRGPELPLKIEILPSFLQVDVPEKKVFKYFLK